jgi:hypothetical protein
MKRFSMIAAFLLLCSLLVVAQPALGPVRTQNYVPTGVCSLPNQLVIVTINPGAGQYQCVNSGWVRTAFIYGTIMPGHCTYWFSATQVGDAGAACGAGGSMTWPTAAGIALYGGSSTWGTSITWNAGSSTATLNITGNAGGNAATATNLSTSGTANQVWGMNAEATAQGWQTVSGGSVTYPGIGIAYTANGSSWGTSLTKFGTAAGLATSTDPGATAEVPMVADGTHGQKPSAGGALGTAAFTASTAYDVVGAAAAVTTTSLGAVPTTTTVNGHALSSNVTVTSADTLIPVTASTSSPVTVAAGAYWNNSSGAMTFNLPTITSGTVGMKFCFQNDDTRTGAITVTAPTSTKISLNGATNSTPGTVVSTGALGDSVCVIAYSTTLYKAFTGSGTWSNN